MKLDKIKRYDVMKLRRNIIRGFTLIIINLALLIISNLAYCYESGSIFFESEMGIANSLRLTLYEKYDINNYKYSLRLNILNSNKKCPFEYFETNYDFTIHNNKIFKITKYRSPYISCILSYLCPGLGQYYNGEILKGVLQQTIMILIIFTAISNNHSDEGGYLLAELFFGTWLWSIIDAGISANRINKQAELINRAAYYNTNEKWKGKYPIFVLRF
ncbi:hypothetical protein KAU33_15265 [Candidatus Dependentiae bacterium]|nr:hypothetical protein [Candidatus Dependentiae bacterium]